MTKKLPAFPCEDCGGEGFVTFDDWSHARAAGEGGPDEAKAECEKCDGDGQARCVWCGDAVDADGSETEAGVACAACADDEPDQDDEEPVTEPAGGA